MSEVQSITFKKRFWSVPRAKKWLREHDYTSKKVDVTPTLLRFRQQPASRFKRIRTKPITPSISLVLGFKE